MCGEFVLFLLNSGVTYLLKTLFFMFYSIVSTEALKRALALLAILAVVFGPFSNVFVAEATNDNHTTPTVDNGKIVICHFNRGNGYTSNEVSISSTGELSGGHGNHDNDIIPAYDWTDSDSVVHHESGKNWTADNQIIWSNGGCNGVVPPPVVDVCPNLPDTQATVPSGYQLVGGQCIPVPPVDVCPNITGSQATVPTGYVLVGGECVVPPVDLCPNITGVQSVVPDGKQIDNTGNCVDIPPPPVDVCTNLDGLQTVVPTGYTAAGTICTPIVPPADFCPNIDGIQDVIPAGKQLDNAGNCVDIPPPPVDVCTNLDGLQTTLPTGYTVVGTICTAIPLPVDLCPNIVGDQATIPDGMIVNNAGECVPAPTPVCAVGNNLLTNASFEEPVVAGNGNWSIFNTVAGWTISLSDGLEIWHNLFGTASEGEQNVELDGNAPTKITQTVATIPGATYELKFDFSARPNTGSTENNVDALVNGSVLMNATADGSAIAVNTWSSHTQTFVAAGTSTEISFADKGTANAVGSLVDNTALCLVRVPEPVKACSINVVSDVTNTVTESANVNAVLTWVHPSWLANIASSTAAWIWSSADVQNPTQNETKTFVKTFTWNGPATTAVLKIATDNSYVAKLNGTQVAADSAGDNFTAADTVDVVANIVTGQNTLEITVTNIGVGGAAAHDNPAGLLYNLSVVGNTDVDCAKLPDVTDNGPDTYMIFGTVWHDEDEDDSIDEGEDDLSGWTVRAVNASNSEDVKTTTTDAAGHYEFNVAAGTWIISELTEDGWVLLSDGDSVNGVGTYTVTVPAPVVITLLDWFIPTAHAATLASFGPFNFGNDNVGGSSRGGSSSGTRTNRTPAGSVLGASTMTPTGLVLGDATSTLPVGAPNTGAGGASAVTFAVPTLNAILNNRVATQKSK